MGALARDLSQRLRTIRKYWLPTLHRPSYLHELVLPQQVVMAHPASESAYIDTTKESLLLIGPEGGFSDDEVSSLLKNR